MALLVESSNRFEETTQAPARPAPPISQPAGQPVRGAPAPLHAPAQSFASQSFGSQNPGASAFGQGQRQGTAQPAAPQPVSPVAAQMAPAANGTGFATPSSAPQFPQAHYPAAAHQAMSSGGTAPAGTKLISEEELKLLNAIAALQIRYGKSEEAIAWLAMVRRQYPQDYQSARLYAVALLKLNRFEEANHAIGELEQIEREGGFALLYRSLLDFKNNHVASARAWFQKFLGQRSRSEAVNS